MPKALNETSSLDSLWDEVMFTEARMLADSRAKDLVAPLPELRKRVEAAKAGQLTAWQGELVAQAGVTAVDDDLDDWVQALHLAFVHTLDGKTESPRYRRYFSEPPSVIKRMGLEAELARVWGWVDSLASEPEEELKAMAASLRVLIERADAALEGRRRAAAERTDHRVRTINALIEDVNNARLALYGRLAAKAAELRLPRNWPDRFFQRSSRSPKPETEVPAVPSGDAKPPSSG